MSLTLPPMDANQPQTQIQKFQKLIQDIMEWTKNQYNKQYENWMPWVEDQYLKWFTNDNKASYTTKDNLSKTKVTGDSRIDRLQDDVGNLAGNQLGQGGLAQPIGDAFSKEGVNRAERGGKDDSGRYAPAQGGPLDSVVEGSSAAGGKVADGAKGAGGYLGGWFKGGEKEGQGQGQRK